LDLFPNNPEYAEISASEMPILAAQSLERERLVEANNHLIEFSIFLAPPDLETDLNDRLFQWKKNPALIPDSVREILSPKISKESLISIFQKGTAIIEKPKFKETSFGLCVVDSSNHNPDYKMKSLLKLIPLQKGDWVFPYYD
jgi:hypothetical protein